MRTLGTLLTFLLLVFSAHWAILTFNPGIAEPHTATSSAAPNAVNSAKALTPSSH